MASNLPASVPPPQVDQGMLARAWTFVSQYATAPLRFSLAGRAALALFVFLVLLVVAVWLLLQRDPNVVTWESSMTPPRMALVVAMVVLTPLATYYALRSWLEQEKSPFPDIDYAWKAGLSALRGNGIALESTPVFLILGSANERQEKSLLDAARLPMRVESAPEGPAALHWYANPECVFLCCTETSWLSSFRAVQEKRAVDAGTRTSAAAPAAPARSAPPPPQPPAQPTASPVSGSVPDQPTGTIMLDQFMTGAAASAAGPAQPEPDGHRGTIMLQPAAAAPAVQDPVRGTANAVLPAEVTALDQPALVPAQDSARQLRRLQYVCKMLQQARQPVCPLNGILALLPFQTVQGSPSEAEELQRAVKSDLATIQRELRLRAPVSALVVGLERESGFRELVRRVGRDRAASQRFGRKYDVRSVATPDELRSLTAHVCGAFEDWIYTLFREQGALSRPGNTRLYSLLCKVRCTLKPRLSEVLSGGFGADPQRARDANPHLFSGCYFAATGETPDRQAFVRGVIDKLVDEQEDVEWTPHALSDERRYRRWATLGVLVAGLLFVTGAAALISMFSRP